VNRCGARRGVAALVPPLALAGPGLPVARSAAATPPVNFEVPFGPTDIGANAVAKAAAAPQPG
jgi:hypothetical protein